MTKFCPECGTKLNDKEAFCPNCGEKVDNISIKSDNDLKRTKMITIAVIAIIVIIGAVFIIGHIDPKGTPHITIKGESGLTTEDSVRISLESVTDEGLADKTIHILFKNDDNRYEFDEKTNSNGNVKINTDFEPGTYDVICEFEGDFEYHETTLTQEVTISEPEPDYESYSYSNSFEDTDKDGNGYVYLSDMNMPHTPQDAQNRMFADSDDDHDGKLNSHEYYKFMYKLNYDRPSYGIV